jgi:hypothetical protein
MLGFAKSFFGKAVTGILLVLAAYAGWLWGPQVFPRIHDALGIGGGGGVEEIRASPALADSVMLRIQGLARRNDSGSLALGSSELTSLVRHSASARIPFGVTSPEVRVEGNRIEVRARVALEAFPDLPDLGPVLGMLPDTLDVAIRGSVMPFGDGRAVLLVQSLEASRIPLPKRLIPEILGAMGRETQPGLPPEALLVPLPSGLNSAYILADSLILSTEL